jgi:proteic killer suppression protein
MIISFKHKGLRLFWEHDDGSKLPFQQIKRIRILLQVIDELKDVPKDLAHLVSLRPHPLKGEYRGFWSLDITGNYRIIFRFENGDAYDVNYLDTH